MRALSELVLTTLVVLSIDFLILTWIFFQAQDLNPQTLGQIIGVFYIAQTPFLIRLTLLTHRVIQGIKNQVYQVYCTILGENPSATTLCIVKT